MKVTRAGAIGVSGLWLVALWAVGCSKPEGGAEGGRIVVTGTPEVVDHHKQSHTGRFLKEHLRR